MTFIENLKGLIDINECDERKIERNLKMFSRIIEAITPYLRCL